MCPYKTLKYLAIYGDFFQSKDWKKFFTAFKGFKVTNIPFWDIVWSMEDQRWLISAWIKSVLRHFHAWNKLVWFHVKSFCNASNSRSEISEMQLLHIRNTLFRSFINIATTSVHTWIKRFKLFPIDETRIEQIVVHPTNSVVISKELWSFEKSYNNIVDTMFVGCSTTLFKSVFIKREQLASQLQDACRAPAPDPLWW